MKIIDASKLEKITKPGIYAELPDEFYHGQLTPEPSLSSSMARTLANECPAMLYARSYLNENYEREKKTHFEVGQAVHLLYLEEEKFRDRIAVLDFNDYRKKEAQGARDDARAEGRIPLLVSQFREIRAMREALYENRIARQAFAGEGYAELSAVWKDKETGVWLKARPDYTPASFSHLVDLKTSTTANPRDFAKKAYNYGYHQQAAWYLDGIEALTGERPKNFWFVVQDKSDPFLCSVAAFDEDAIIAGRERNREAIRQFAECVEKNEWPGYRREETPDRDSAFILTLPGWAQREVDMTLNIAAD